MNDAECVAFLRASLPRLHLWWPGFRKIRIVCKRIDRRLKELGLSGIVQYRAYLESHPAEWKVLDTFCRIPISRFYRDTGVFQFLEQETLSRSAERAIADGEVALRCWSVGCASGEKPYTLAILWKHAFAFRFPLLRFGFWQPMRNRRWSRDPTEGAIRRAASRSFPKRGEVRRLSLPARSSVPPSVRRLSAT